MKILFHSNSPWASSGYGQQTAIFTPMFQDAGHDVAISAFWGLHGSSLGWRGMMVYPSEEPNQGGNKWLPANVAHHAGGEDKVRDVQVITLMDVWLLNNPRFADLRMASWVPVDHDPAPPAVSQFFHAYGVTPIAMSRFGQDRLEQDGLEPLYVPHGIDTELMRPMDKRAVRRAMKLPEDAFIVGMVANNSGAIVARKAFAEVFQAFAALQKKHKDVMLYVHSTAKPDPKIGMDLLAAAHICGVDTSAIIFTPEYELFLGVEPEKMPYVFNAFDVLAQPSYGEGFGICAIEAQACGVPVITQDFSAMTELTGAGWKVGGHRWFDNGHGAFFQLPHVSEIHDAMCEAYDSAHTYAEKARDFALAYDAKLVMERYWKPVLAKLEADAEPSKRPKSKTRKVKL